MSGIWDDPCTWCGENINDGVDGMHYIDLYTEENGEKIVKQMPYHKNCYIRQFIGSLSHVLKQCSCYMPGNTDLDPPNMTKREAATAAVRAWQELPEDYVR